MPFDDGLNAQADVTRRESGSGDSWRTIEAGMPCRVVAMSAMEAQALSQEWSQTVTHRGIAPLYFDVQDGDRLTVYARKAGRGERQTLVNAERYDVVVMDRAEGGRLGAHHWRMYLSRTGTVRP